MGSPVTNDTSIHMRRAGQGDRTSLEWIVVRFTPLLLVQAKYRLGPRLRTHCEPEDLVQDVWALTLPRLAGLCDREARVTPVVLKFLSTALLYRVNDLLKQQVRRSTCAVEGADAKPRPVSELPAQTSGVLNSVIRREQRDSVTIALEELDDPDREILILRGIEQNINGTVATLLSLAPNTVSMRYRRALDRLRERLPQSVFDELDAS
jgi:RNA polymerase sigma factor (sigma-70 family)